MMIAFKYLFAAAPEFPGEGCGLRGPCPALRKLGTCIMQTWVIYAMVTSTLG